LVVWGGGGGGANLSYENETCSPTPITSIRSVGPTGRIVSRLEESRTMASNIEVEIMGRKIKLRRYFVMSIEL